MTDDLVKRLRDLNDHMNTFILDEAADRIEQLEAELHSCFHRIEELQAALREIAEAVGDPSAYWIARKALEGKND